MKAKIKRLFKRILLILIVSISVVKIYFECDNYNYKLKLGQMEESGDLAIQVNSSIEHKTLKIHGSKIHYYVSGEENEKSIVFLHAAFSDHRLFDLQIDYFAKDYKVITIDLIGHGLSKVNKSNDKIDASHEHIAKILEAEDILRTHLVGVSVGALIAQYFILKHPSKVQSLTVLGGYDINSKNKEIQNAQRGVNLSLIFRALFSMNAFRKKSALLTCSSERGQALFYKTMSHYERKSFMVMQGLQNIIKDRESAELDYPTFIMSGELEIELAKKMGKAWHSALKNSDYFIIKNAGHCANLDEAPVFNKKVKEFIDKHN
jgi:pimeloyl-ACP methyl ester carboxylesterase